MWNIWKLNWEKISWLIRLWWLHWYTHYPNDSPVIILIMCFSVFHNGTQWYESDTCKPNYNPRCNLWAKCAKLTPTPQKCRISQHKTNQHVFVEQWWGQAGTIRNLSVFQDIWGQWWFTDLMKSLSRNWPYPQRVHWIIEHCVGQHTVLHLHRFGACILCDFQLICQELSVQGNFGLAWLWENKQLSLVHFVWQ